MSSIIQPLSMASDSGVMLSVGVVAGGNRMEMVFPLATDNGTLSFLNGCNDAVVAWEAVMMSMLLDLLSLDAYVSFLNAEGMMDGFIPFRRDYASTTNPGTRPAGLLPEQDGLLLVFYAWPDDLTPGTRMRVGKNFVPGVSASDWTSTSISGTLQTNAGLFVDELQNGFPTIDDPGKNWYRVLSRPRPSTAPQPVIRTYQQMYRGYLGIQRRRVLPH